MNFPELRIIVLEETFVGVELNIQNLVVFKPKLYCSHVLLDLADLAHS